MIIKPATPADIPIIRQLIEDLAEYERLRDDCKITDQDLQTWLFDTPKAEAVIAWEDQTPAGFALYFINFSTFAGKPGIYLEDLFVKPEHRGKGYGKALMMYLAKLATQNSYARFEWSVLDWNEPSIEFYKSLGAEIKPEWNICRLAGESLEKLAQS